MEKAARTKKHIMECALALFGAQDGGEVRVTDICRRAGLADSTYYKHFKTKDEMILDIFLEYTQFTTEDFEKLLQKKTPWEQLWQAHSIYCDKMEYLGKKLCAQYYKSEGDFAPVDDQGRSVLLPLMEHAREAGIIRNDAPTERIFFCSCYLMEGIYHVWAFSDTSFDLKREVRNALEVYYNLPKELWEG